MKKYLYIKPLVNGHYLTKKITVGSVINVSNRNGFYIIKLGKLFYTISESLLNAHFKKLKNES